MNDTLFTDKKITFDLDSMEIIYFFIPEFHVFREYGVSLYPRYNIQVLEYESENHFLKICIKEKVNFIDLFEKERINLKIICGKNGVGKTTFLDLLSGSENPGGIISLSTDLEVKKNNCSQRDISCITIYKDKNDNFASTEKVYISFNNKEIVLDSSIPVNSYEERCEACVNHNIIQIDGWEFEKNILNSYFENPELYDDIFLPNGQLFNGFRYKIWKLKNNIQLFKNGYRKELYETIDKYYMEDILNNNPVMFYFFFILQDSYYDSTVEKLLLDLSNNNEKINLITVFENFWIDSGQENEYQQILEKQNEIFHKDYLLSQKDDVVKKLLDFQDDVYEILDKMLNHLGARIYENIKRDIPFVSVVYPEGFYKIEYDYRTVNDLSSGEMKSCEYRYELFHSLSQTKGCFITKDEPENYLHPEWCRCFLNLYIKAYTHTKEYIYKISKEKRQKYDLQKRFTVIISTHSPFLLSDVTNDYIIYLDKDKNGIAYEVNIEKESFAGNICEMYCSNMFMENTIGEFARVKLKEIINNIDKNKDIDEKQMKKYKKLISKVGDDLLRKLLEDKVKDYEKNNYFR